MVSIFPPSYGLISIFNVSENSILDIIEFGYSKEFHDKIVELKTMYLDSKGIDELKVPFISRLKKRCKDLNEEEGYDRYNFDIELDKILTFFDIYLKNPESYFIEYVKTGRRLKKVGKQEYLDHKLACVSYTPFGVFNDRRNISFKKSSKQLYFDIDEDLTLTEKKKLIEFFLNDDYIKASWLSFSKKGFGFVIDAKWSTEKEMKKIYYKAIEYFTLRLQAIGFTKRLFDTQVCSLSRMNFISNGMIKRKTDYLEFRTTNYSDDLFNKLHETYQKNSKRKLPTRPFYESDVIKKQQSVFTQTSDESSFIKTITKNVSYFGSNDYYSAIKEFVSIVFRYNVCEKTVEDCLFENIPYNDKTNKMFLKMWKSYSNYSEFRTVETKNSA